MAAEPSLHDLPAQRVGADEAPASYIVHAVPDLDAGALRVVVVHDDVQLGLGARRHSV
jgi:hypothetical protein